MSDLKAVEEVQHKLSLYTEALWRALLNFFMRINTS